MILSYSTAELIPYINWVYFFYAWGLKNYEQDTAKEQEAQQLKQDALHTLQSMEKKAQIRSLFRILEANSEEDDLWIEGLRFPLLRQQSPSKPNTPCLCLSDFIRPRSQGIADHIGIFASSVILENENQYQETDPYQHLLIQTLSDRLAEAATEKMHQYVRKIAWGYAPEEDLSIPDLLMNKFQGIRPAVGYPSLPDQSINLLLDQLIQMHQIGITLTENGAMHPHASVSGLMFAHPAARYFNIGKIGTDQLRDYAERRGVSVEEMKKFLPNHF